MRATVTSTTGSPAARHALVDGNRVPDGLPCPATAIIDGDALEPAIMAASILAKVARDARMRALHQQYPAYGFDRHKGYPSPLHREALRLRGELQSEEALTWDEELSTGAVLVFERPGGWLSGTNFGDEPVAMPEGELLIASAPLAAADDAAQQLPGATTVWLQRTGA